MHHLPAGPSLTGRLSGVLSRTADRVRRALAMRPGRAVPLLVMAVALVVLGIAAPVVSGAVSGRGVSLDDSSLAASSTTPEDADITMGVDGRDQPGSGTSSAAGQAGATTDRPGTSTTTSGSGTVPPAPAGTPTVAGTPAPDTTTGPTTTTTAGGSATSPAGTPSTGTGPSSTGTGTAAADGSATGSTPAADTSSPAATPAAPAAPAVVPAAGGAVLALVNQARGDAGCSALTTDAALTDLAEQHSGDMGRAGLLGLTGLGGRTAVVAQGEATAASVVGAWLADTSTRSRLLDCDRSLLGVGEASGADGPWWTALLA